MTFLMATPMLPTQLMRSLKIILLTIIRPLVQINTHNLS